MLADLVSAEEEDETHMLMMAPAPDEAGADKGYPQDDNWSELRMTLEQNAAESQALLQAALEKATEEMKPALQQAIEISAAGYERALEALD
jgi:hypothetical protein